MPTRLSRSVPFWTLTVGSAATLVGGIGIFAVKTAEMSVGLAAQTASYEVVYVNPEWIGLGSILIGAGVVGLLLALAVASVGAVVPSSPDVVADASSGDEVGVVVDEPAPVALEDADIETPQDAEAPAGAAEAPGANDASADDEHRS